jgi:cysteine-rich repeat protein
MNRKIRIGKVALVLLVSGFCTTFFGQPVQAQPAPNSNSVLILGSTVSGGAGSREAVFAAANGFTVVVDSAAAWGARTTADFATFRAIILGDATCTSLGVVAAAVANKAVWGPAINGNVIINGTDPVYHQGQGGDALTQDSVKFAADEPTKTGAYISLSCYYHGTAPGTPVPLLDPFGSFTMRGVGCYDDSHIVATHPALSSSTDATLSNWGCSVHEAFDSTPSSFLPLAIAENVCNPATDPACKTFADASVGLPYIMARGETLSPIRCGNGILEATEECDDGNTTNGDGCSAQCTIEAPTDTTAPSCTLTAILPGPPTQIKVTAQDTGSGLASITPVISTNAVVTYSPSPPFGGTTAPVIVTGTKINQSLKAQVMLEVKDVAGNTTTCDPVLTLLVRENGKPVTETLTDIPDIESQITIANGSPGIKNLLVTVNGVAFRVNGLKDFEERSFDVSSAMRPGDNNTITLTAWGKPGSQATIIVSE